MMKNKTKPVALKYAKDFLILLAFFLFVLPNSTCITLNRNKNIGEYAFPESPSEKKEESEIEIRYSECCHPEFPGGNAALMKFLSDSMRYPVIAMDNGIQGRVILKFTVNEDGTLSDIQVVRGVDPELDQEAVRLVKSMPKWKPGIEKGEKVKKRFTLPVVFRLDKSEPAGAHRGVTN